MNMPSITLDEFIDGKAMVYRPSSGQEYYARFSGDAIIQNHWPHPVGADDSTVRVETDEASARMFFLSLEHLQISA